MRRSYQPSDKTLAFPAYAVELGVDRFYQDYLQEINITFHQFLVITSLADGRPKSVKSIAEVLGLHSSTISPILNKLEKDDLIARRRGTSEDQRVALVTLTAEARVLANQLIVIQANVDLDFGMIGEEINRLRKTLLILARGQQRPTSDSTSIRFEQ